MGRNRDALDGMTPEEKEQKWEDAETLPTGFGPPHRQPVDPYHGIGFEQVGGVSSYDTEAQFGDQSLYDFRDHDLTSEDLEGFREEFKTKVAAMTPRDSTSGARRGAWMNFLSQKMHEAAREKSGLTGESWKQAQKLRGATREDRDAAPWETAIRQRYANAIREAYGRAGRFGGDRAAQARAIGRSASRAVPELEQYIQTTRDAEREQAIQDFSGLKVSLEAGEARAAEYKAGLLANYQDGQDARDNAQMAGLLSLLGTGIGAGIGFFAGGPSGAMAGAAIGGGIGDAAGSAFT